MTDSHTLELIGEFGIVFLMFTIGLEISLKKMNSMRREIFFNGFLQVVLSAVIFYILARYALNLEAIASTIIALALSLSSTAVVLTHLKTSKEIHLPYGERSVGILIFQDLAVIPMLLFLGFLTSQGVSIEIILLETFLSAIVVIGLLLVVGKRVINWILRFSAESGLEELFMGSVFVIVVGASLFAHTMGFTYSLGAFVAGMIIAETRYHHKVEADIAPFKDLLLGTFFVTVGMKIDVHYFWVHLESILGILALIFLVKAVVIFFLLLITSPKDTSLKSAMALSQIGEFSFAIFAVASSYGLLDESLIQSLILMVVVSMIVTPFLISKVNDIVIRVFKEPAYENNYYLMKKRRNHIVVCGYGAIGKQIVKKLANRSVSYAIVDNNLEHIKEAQHLGLEAYYGDISKKMLLEALHVEDAAAIIVAVEDLEKKRLICEAISDYTKDVNIIVKVSSFNDKAYLKDCNISTFIDSKDEVANMIVQASLQCQLSFTAS
jgi:CPA2 family monovalent cation:H+ antiporter-2